jgi:hypothetical protein
MEKNVKSSVTAMATVATVLLLAPTRAMSQELPNSRALPGNEAPAGPYVLSWGIVSKTPPAGRPENMWRYRLHDGRWWYWTKDRTWQYYTGDVWVPYTPASDHYLSRRSPLGPIAGPMVGQGVVVRGNSAGLTLIPGDHPGAPHLKRGTVLPRYLNQEALPEGQEPTPDKPTEQGPTPDADQL